MGRIARVGRPEVQTGDLFRDSAMGLVPETVDDIGRLNRAVWSGAVRPALLEIVRLRNARTVNCTICKAVRYDVARADGLTEDKVDDIRDGHETSALSATEKLALTFADAYLFEPKGVTPELARALRSGFSPEELATLAIGLASFNAGSRCAVALGGLPASMPVTEISVP
jgi:alkylhydroperoxidase family enzyme